MARDKQNLKGIEKIQWKIVHRQRQVNTTSVQDEKSILLNPQWQQIQ